MREFLVHINVQTEREDIDVEELERAIGHALVVGSDHPSLDGMDIEIAMAEEV